METTAPNDDNVPELAAAAEGELSKATFLQLGDHVEALKFFLDRATAAYNAAADASTRDKLNRLVAIIESKLEDIQEGEVLQQSEGIWPDLDSFKRNLEISKDVASLEALNMEIDEGFERMGELNAKSNVEKIRKRCHETAFMLGKLRDNVGAKLRKVKQEIIVKALPRVETIDFEVMEQSLIHDLDLNQFKDNCMKLFQWHVDEGERSKYLAPYFPIVQSSGMGKTKLLQSMRQLVLDGNDKAFQNCTCHTILCSTNADDAKLTGPGKVYSHFLRVPSETSREAQEEITTKLDNIENAGCRSGTKSSVPIDGNAETKVVQKVLLLFDETQHLLGSNGFFFRCVRWWLRLERRVKAKERDESPVVAVFAGTTSRLTNFYVEPPDSHFSRHPSLSLYADSGNALYPPFHKLHTIGIFALKVKNWSRYINDYERSIPYGRPLFALMQEKGNFTGDKLFSILCRMLLFDFGDSVSAWFHSRKGCLSVLGSRFQMGQVSVAVASDLVSRGYALLTHVKIDEAARICFPTDPVCAHLAMRLMDETCSIVHDSTKTTITGKGKEFWIEKLSEIYSSGLCPPNQGDLGEIGAAAYLLFCGDLLRRELDSTYKTFSVSLATYVQVLVDKESHMEGRQHDQAMVISSAEFSDARVSFIQVVRNYFRTELKDINQRMLRDMYQSGSAFYSYPGTHGYDIVASICLIGKDNVKLYVPFLVSVSTKKNDELNGGWTKLDAKMKKTRMVGLDAKMKKGKMFGLILHVIFYEPTANEDLRDKYLLEPSGVSDLTRDLLERKTVSKVLYVNKKKCFGITETLLEKTTFGPEESEIYASHSAATSFTEANSTSLLRKTLRSNDENDAAANYLKEICKAFSTAQEPGTATNH